MIQNLKLFSAH